MNLNLPFIDKLTEAGGECYLLGGALRDEWAGINPEDFDFVVRKLPVSQIQSICEEFGIARINKVMNGAVRLETKDFGIVDLSLPKVLRNGAYEFDPDIQMTDHLRYIDFKMNCIYQKVGHPEIYDYYGAVQDIRDHKISINPAQDSLMFNPIIPIRAARFASKLGFLVDKNTMNIFRRDRDILWNLPNERLRYEMYRLICTDHNYRGRAVLEEVGIYDRLMEIYMTYFSENK